MANYQYCVATNWGSGFITDKDSREISPIEYVGNVWRTPINNQYANRWVVSVLGERKTLAEAQAIVDSEISTAQTNWDNNNIEGETSSLKIARLGARPENIVLEE
jgi:hypothetical protein|tara:strand:- start:1215 stop:1529 length:315 start_codon:yes stop_codon:yes gene_type:complete